VGIFQKASARVDKIKRKRRKEVYGVIM